MKASGLKPTQVVYNTMLSACEKGGDLLRATSLLQEMIMNDVARDVITWNTIISACKERGEWERATGLLEEMQAVDGIQPDTISYNAAIAACAKGSAVDQAKKLLVAMQKAGARRDTCTYNSLMDAHARAGNFPAVLQTLEMMASDQGGVRPDVISFTQALRAAERTRDFDAADKLLAAMKKEGVKWNVYTYAVMMSICEKTGRWPMAVRLLQDMRRRGLTPDSTCYTVVMNACATGGNFTNCLTLLDAMKADGVAPTIHTFTVLLTAAVSSEEVSQSSYIHVCIISSLGRQRDVCMFVHSLVFVPNVGCVHVSIAFTQNAESGCRTSHISFKYCFTSYYFTLITDQCVSYIIQPSRLRFSPSS